MLVITKIPNSIERICLACVAVSLPLAYTPAANNYYDNFTKTEIPAKGTSDAALLADAPNPSVVIAGEKKNAKFVVELSTNTLYKYNSDGSPEAAYKVASGKKSTPTHKGVRIVTHTETYPYNGAPLYSKRRRNPNDYGPRIICVNEIEPKTGVQSPTGEFIHGTSDPAALGKYVSHGCIRMDNEVIIKLAAEARRGDIVIIK